MEAFEGMDRRWTPSYLTVGSVEIPYVGRLKAIQTINRSFLDRAQIRVAFCNANTMLQALKSEDYATALSGFLVLNDGVGVDLCSVLFRGRTFDDNLNGTDFVPELLRGADIDLRIFLLGGAPGTAERAGQRLAADYPRHGIVGARDGYFAERDTDAVVSAINAAAPDLLLVAMGNPRQEAFIARTRGRLAVPVVMAVGAFLDFTAGEVVRAPAVVRALRAEWLFRLAQEPRRLGRRYTIDVAAFLFTMLRLRVVAALGARGRAGAQASTDHSRRRLRPAD